MNVLLVQCDGKMPNLALMRIAAHHRAQGDYVYLSQVRNAKHDFQPTLFDRWDKVYASLIFTKSQPIARAIKAVYPQAVIAGSGWNCKRTDDYGIPEQGPRDFTDYPAFRSSLGFSQRGCRLSCGFCKVPEMEGKVRDVATIREIWRGEPWPKEIILLDNDFFGSPTWREKLADVKAGGFKLSLSQGVNARLMSEEQAAALASVDYRNDAMDRKCIHTAWDSLDDERPLFRGLNAFKKAGVRPDNITVYMLVGYGSERLTDADFERHRKLREFGCRPYPMPYVRTPQLVGFQRWVVRRADMICSWESFERANYRPEKVVAS
jgi:hypothetical protein